jgi:malate dehydrogenase
VPVTIGRKGWEKILDIDLNEEEKELFAKSAEAVRSMNDVLKTL